MNTHVKPDSLLTTSAASPDGVDGRPHAVVIGAGFGGLAAAVRLGARGYQVTVVEKLEQAVMMVGPASKVKPSCLN
ncbi:MAG: NAD(P)-binding protein, partial [Pseudomonadota bacterium]